MLVPPPLPWLIETLPTAVEPFTVAVSRALPWVIVRLPANPARTGLPCVYPTLSPDIRAESGVRLPATSCSLMEMLPGTVELVTLAELPLPAALTDDDIGREKPGGKAILILSGVAVAAPVIVDCFQCHCPARSSHPRASQRG